MKATILEAGHDELRQLLDVLRSSEADSLPPELIKRAGDVIAEQRVEVAQLFASAKQRRFQKAFFDRADEKGRPCGIYVALGGNRSGKSFACGWLCFAKFIRDEAKSGDWFWTIAPTLERSIPGVQRELWNAMPRIMFGNQAWDEKTGFGQRRKVKLRTRDGGTCVVEFRSSDQDPQTFEQAKLSGVWADERLPEAIYNRILARVIDRNGFILYSDIPEQAWHVDRLEEAAPEAGVYFMRMAMEDNRSNLPAGAIEQAASRMTADEIALRIKGESVVMEGIIYKEYVDALRPSGALASEKSGHLVTPFNLAATTDWPKFRMIDYGGSAPTGCLWCMISPKEHIYCYREYYQRGGSVNKHAKAILKMSEGERYTGTIIDPAAYNMQPGMEKLADTIGCQYERALGCAIGRWPVVNVMGEHAMVQKVKYRLENRTLWVFSSCTSLRREFKSWKYKLDKEGKPLAADAFDDTGPCHLLDCLKGLVAMHPVYEQQQIAVESGSSDERPYVNSHISKGRLITVKGKQVRLRLEEAEEE